MSGVYFGFTSSTPTLLQLHNELSAETYPPAYFYCSISPSSKICKSRANVAGLQDTKTTLFGLMSIIVRNRASSQPFRGAEKRLTPGTVTI